MVSMTGRRDFEWFGDLHMRVLLTVFVIILLCGHQLSLDIKRHGYDQIIVTVPTTVVFLIIPIKIVTRSNTSVVAVTNVTIISTVHMIVIITLIISVLCIVSIIIIIIAIIVFIIITSNIVVIIFVSGVVVLRD